MRMPLRGLCWLVLLSLCTQVQADRLIIIMRHGEKPAFGLGQLDCQGLNRSLSLVPVLLAHYGRPSEIYAANPAIAKRDHGRLYAYIRPLATIEPLAVAVGLPVHIDYGMTQIEGLADQLLKSRAQVQVVAWEHHWGEALARLLLVRLGSDPQQVPVWNNEDYDSLYVVRIDDHHHPSFSREAEGLQNLSPSCPGLDAVNVTH